MNQVSKCRALLLILQLPTDLDISYVDIVQYHTIRSINSDFLKLLNIIKSFFK